MNVNRAALDKLYHYCLSLTGTRADALDLLQGSIERHLVAGFDGVENPAAYIRRIARNRFHDALRREQRLPFESLADPSVVIGLERDLEATVIDELTVAEIWHMLSQAEREVIYLWAVESYSASEIALPLGQPRGTVLARLARLRARLQARGATASSEGGAS